ncbi:hypothetical protein F7725_015080 [Dissostichus mawsoni]|uniref:Prostaglandin-endoperoxide synthase n=1 Tax=Dissostichus mawsoni TaxID=36200 RepID=A0A7J5YHF1_DISMA|nr:hypothetical protein F7725_015080 [Dissostichus mawsoni]
MQRVFAPAEGDEEVKPLVKNLTDNRPTFSFSVDQTAASVLGSVCVLLLMLRQHKCRGDDEVTSNTALGCVLRFGDEYECDCTLTGYYGVNCTVLLVQSASAPQTTPDVLHYILTHFQWLWDVINSTFLRDSRRTAPLPGGKAVLPDPELLVERLLRRRTFRPDPQGSNLLFAFFAQHFTHQFFKTYNRMGLGFTKALAHGVDAGHIYGDNLQRQLVLRLHRDGKLKYQMSYPPGTPPENQMAIGQEVFGLLPGLGMFATLWLREHNRTIRIVIEEYVQHLSGYLLKLKFDPTLLFKSNFQYGNRISLEFTHLFLISGDQVTYPQFLFNTSVLTHYGIEKLVDAFSKQVAGQRSNSAIIVFAANEEIALELEELYGDIDALEFYPGLMLEQTRPGALFGESMVEMGAPFSLKGLLGNPICSPNYWKPSTFGGRVGFDIVNSATLKKLVCLNTRTCPYVAFRIPAEEREPEGDSKERTDEL